MKCRGHKRVYTIKCAAADNQKYNSTMDECLQMRSARPWTNGCTVDIIDKEKQDNAMTKPRLMGEYLPTKRLQYEQGMNCQFIVHLFSTCILLGVLSEGKIGLLGFAVAIFAMLAHSHQITTMAHFKLSLHSL